MVTTERTAATPPAAAQTAGVLAIVALATTDFLAVLDGLLVAVVLPDIRAELGFSQAGLGWVVTAYVLAFAGCLLLFGRIADLFGRKRVLLGGYAVFAVGGLVAGLAQSPGALVGGRVLQGLGAAAMTPAGLSLLTVAFPAGPARDRALGAWSAAGSVGIPAGALLGGFLSATVGWRWVLLVNVPAAILAAALAAATLPESRAKDAARSLDVRGAVTGTGGLAAAVLALTQLEPLVSGHPGPFGDNVVLPVVVPAVAAVVLLAAFWRIETRAENPLLPPRILRLPGFLRANLAAAGLPIGLGAMMFVATQYVQVVLGLSAWETGLVYLALALPVIAASPAASWLVSAVGRRRTAVLGFVMQATGLAILAVAGDGASLATTVIPAFVITGAGAPIAYIPVTAAAVDGVEDDSGLASGVLNTTQQVSNALGLAAMATAVALGSVGSADLSVGGLQAGFVVGAVLALLAAVAAAGLAERRGPAPRP